MVWRPKKISELGKVVTGKTPSTKNPEFYGAPFQFVTPTDLDWMSYYVQSTHSTVTQLAKTKHKNQFVPEGTTFVTCIGNTIGKSGIAKEDCLTNQQINSIVPNEQHDPLFVYYLMNYCRPRIRSIGLSGGAAQPIINKTTFSSIEVKTPEKPVQKKIADTLSAYDDLIENNRRRIALLEESARLLYREWFVHLRFPGHETTKIVDGIPEGWKLRKVGEILSKVKSRPKIKKADYLLEGKFPCVDQSQDFIGGYTNADDAVYEEILPVVIFGDHTRVLKYINFPFARGADGTQVCCSKDERLSNELLYFSLKELDLSNYFYARHFKFLKSLEILIPTSDLNREFSLFASQIFEQIKTLRLFNKKLAEARDLLLPRLMDGRLEVAA